MPARFPPGGFRGHNLPSEHLLCVCHNLPSEHLLCTGHGQQETGGRRERSLIVHPLNKCPISIKLC